MQNETNTPDTFTIYRDGKPDPRAARREHIRALKYQFRKDMKKMLAPVGQGLMRTLDEWDLYTYDQRHGTHLLADYRKKHRRDRDTNMARAYGLAL